MPVATPTAAGSGRSCASAPPTTTLIDAPFQPSNASHSAARSDSMLGRAHRLGRDRGYAERARQGAGDRQTEALYPSHPAGGAVHDHRPDASGLDDGRQRADALGIGVGEPQHADLHVGREIGDIPRQPAKTRRGKVGRQRNDRDAAVARSLHDEFVARADAAAASQLHRLDAEPPRRLVREPRSRDRERQVGAEDRQARDERRRPDDPGLEVPASGRGPDGRRVSG